MGKAYSSELDQVKETLDWCSRQSVDLLRVGANQPLICVGAGGSFSAAVFAAACVERQFGAIAIPMTPLEYVQRSRYLAGHATLLISAEGKNADILHAAATAVAAAGEVSALTFSPASPLVQLLHERSPHAAVLALAGPWGKDGYLATNSLMATVALLAKRFGYTATGERPLLELEKWRAGRPLLVDALTSGADLLVLHDVSGRTAAVDAESKFAEAALGTVQLCDLRQFAHGRHVQLVHGRNRMACLAIVSEEELELWMATRRELPQGVAVATCLTPSDLAGAALTGLCAVYGLVEAVAIRGAQDPGQPDVPVFARRLHALKTVAYEPLTANSAAPHSRKVQTLLRSGQRPSAVIASLRRIRSALESAKFRSVALDFDGTCCETSRRLEGIDAGVASELLRLGRLGVQIGFATGRGDSLYQNLRAVLPSDVWPSILLGCHSGSTMVSLTDSWPSVLVDPMLSPLLKTLDGLGINTASGYLVRAHGGQLTVEHRDTTRFSEAALILNEATLGMPGWRLFRSAHSMDLLTPTTSKRTVVDRLEGFGQAGTKAAVLRIGDRGEVSGNDWEWLQDPCGVSVDGVSPDPDSCWDAYPFEGSALQRTLMCLQALEPRGDGRVGLSGNWLDSFQLAHLQSMDNLVVSGGVH
jgi:hypothetical protein